MAIHKQSASLVRIKQKFQVTLPTDVREALNLQEGDLLEASVENNRISLNPKVVVDRKSIDAAFEQGMEEYRTSRAHGPFKNMREFKKSLKHR